MSLLLIALGAVCSGAALFFELRQGSSFRLEFVGAALVVVGLLWLLAELLLL